MHPDLVQHVAKTRDLFTKVAEQDGSRERAAWLGLMELERLCGVHEVPTGMWILIFDGATTISLEPSRLLNLLKHYFEIFGDKAACYEDIRSYTDLDSDVLSAWTTILEKTSHTPVSFSNCRQSSAKAHVVLK